MTTPRKSATIRATRQQLADRCRILGVELIAHGHEADLEVLCPRGQIFTGPRTHMLRIATADSLRWRLSDAYAAMLDDLTDGIEPCPDATCDYCTEE